jgi:uncharacterized metal-binding protein
VIIIPNGETHEKMNLVAGTIIAMYLLLKSSFTHIEILIMIIGLLIGTYYLNPDLDTGSRARKRWWILKFIWKPFNHRGILHNPLLWIALFGIAYGIKVIAPAPYIMYASYAPYFAVGITVSALVHIGCDWVMDALHKTEALI